MTMQNDTFGSGLFDDFLETTPEAAFFAASPDFGSTPNRQSFFQNQFRNIHNQFLGALGKQIQGGEDPTLRFTDFLQEPEFFQQQFFATPPAFRGGLPQSVFAPPTRTLFQF